MRPLPRLHAVTDAATLALADFPVRAAAIAAAGSAVALHARDRTAGGALLAQVTGRLLALARPPEASVFVNARPDIAAALGAHGVQLGRGDLSPGEVRSTLGERWHGWIGLSVHSGEEAKAGAQQGADFLMAGSIYPSSSHPGQPVAGLDLIRDAAATGLPVIAIGGITAQRAHEVREAGAYGVAAISAVWSGDDPASAALALLAPWVENT
jgi:thiamine-phosphate pyrophosphorylase